MADGGEVRLETVIAVLQTKGVRVTRSADQTFTLEKEGVLGSYDLGPLVKKRMLHYFQRKFKVPIHFFYNHIPEKESPTTRGASPPTM